MIKSAVVASEQKLAQEECRMQLDYELVRLGLKEPLKALFGEHPKLAKMKSFGEMNLYLSTQAAH